MILLLRLMVMAVLCTYDVDGGKGDSASISTDSNFGSNVEERITITRTAGQDFTFSSIYINNTFGNEITVAGYNDTLLVSSPQTVAAGDIVPLNFSDIEVDEVRLTSSHFTANMITSKVILRHQLPIQPLL